MINLLSMLTRKWYVFERLRLIRIAQYDIFAERTNCSKANGYRAVLDFERINRVKASPWDSLHVEHIAGAGCTKELIRKTRKILRTMEELK